MNKKELEDKLIYGISLFYVGNYDYPIELHLNIPNRFKLIEIKNDIFLKDNFDDSIFNSNFIFTNKDDAWRYIVSRDKSDLFYFTFYYTQEYNQKLKNNLTKEELCKELENSNIYYKFKNSFPFFTFISDSKEDYFKKLELKSKKYLKNYILCNPSYFGLTNI